MYDIIVIGAGISGLYLSNILKKKNISHIVLEKNSRIGGRVGDIKIDNYKVPIGAGVLRQNDKQMIDFYQEYVKEPLEFYRTNIDYSYVQGNSNAIKDTIKYLSYLVETLDDIEDIRHKQNFKQFFLTHLSKKQYKYFMDCNLYNDFSKADIIDTLYDYGFEDNIPGKLVAAPKWDKFLASIYNKLKKNIKLNSGVKKIMPEKVILENDEELFGKKIVACLTSNALQKILPSSVSKFYKNVPSQHFMRMYAVLNKEIPQVKNGFVLLKSPLKKIIHIHKKLYMVAYTEDKYAKFVEDKTSRFFIEELRKIFDMPDLDYSTEIRIYWEEGTHYYKPLPVEYKTREEWLNNAKRPLQNVFVAGSMLSREQGWTLGAVQSIEDILKDLIEK